MWAHGRTGCAALAIYGLVAVAPGHAGAQTSPPPPALIPLAKDDASTILGRPVLDQQGQTAGRITDVLVDALGTVKAAVVDFGGFLGVGQRRIAVAWTALRFEPATRTIRLVMSAPELAATPEYKPDSNTNAVATRPQDITRPTETPPPGTSAPAPGR